MAKTWHSQYRGLGSIPVQGTRSHMPELRVQMPKLKILYATTKSARTRAGADRGSDHELLIAKFRLKLKKVGETTRPFRYDLNQIPYEYTVEVTNRFKGLDLVDSA